jgi:hypothetical protein
MRAGGVETEAAFSDDRFHANDGAHHSRSLSQTTSHHLAENLDPPLFSGTCDLVQWD